MEQQNAKVEQQIAEIEIEGDGRTFWWYVCGECHTVIGRNDKYCRECGRRIVWDE